MLTLTRCCLAGWFLALALSSSAAADKLPPLAPDWQPRQEQRWLEAASIYLLSGKGTKNLPRMEATEMIDMIVNRKMGPGEGWFHPSQSRLGWDWLAAQFDADKDGNISRKEFRGPARLFDRLDRDHDGFISRDDFDWSSQSTFVRNSAMAQKWFRLLDGNSNGRITRKEWEAAFHKAARGKDQVNPQDLSRLLFPPVPRLAHKKNDWPSPLVMLKGLFAGELGSPYEGPRVGQAAPLFTLPRHDGSGKVSLADHIGQKPIVLIFGSFT